MRSQQTNIDDTSHGTSRLAASQNHQLQPRLGLSELLEHPIYPHERGLRVT